MKQKKTTFDKCENNDIVIFKNEYGTIIVGEILDVNNGLMKSQLLLDGFRHKFRTGIYHEVWKVI